jgi:hypothetical protein
MASSTDEKVYWARLRRPFGTGNVKISLCYKQLARYNKKITKARKLEK